MNQILIAGIPTALVSVIAFILMSRKYRSEVNQTRIDAKRKEIDYTERIIRIMRELSERMLINQAKDIDALRREIAITREKISRFIQDSQQTKEQMFSLERQFCLAKVENMKLYEQITLFSQYLKYLKGN